MALADKKEAIVSGRAKTELSGAVDTLRQLALQGAGLDAEASWNCLIVEAQGEDATVTFRRVDSGDLDIDYVDEGYSSNGVHFATKAHIALTPTQVLAEEQWLAESRYPSPEARSGTRFGNQAARQLAINIGRLTEQASLVSIAQ